MTIAILDPFSGIAGDMTLGALIDLGLDPDWLRGLPARLGLENIGVRIESVSRGDIASTKVDFDIPPQPHGRHIKEISRIVAASDAPDQVKDLANRAFMAIAVAEAEIHGTTPERVHLHEVGAVDAILDVVGSIWGLHLLGVDEVYCGTLSLGDGTVKAAHGILPVPAPATLKLLVGQSVRNGPENSGELVTPTGAALVHVLSRGAPPAEFRPLKAGFGAGTKDFKGRANVLRIILAEHVGESGTGLAEHVRESGTEQLAMLAADIDDMTGEQIGFLAESLRSAGALDVTVLTTIMKKGRPGSRVEILCRPDDATVLEDHLLAGSTSIGVRRTMVSRRHLPRRTESVTVLGHDVRVKVVTLPAGEERAKAEFEDLRRVATETGKSLSELGSLAAAEWSRKGL
jgi:pyridinium-3,5-bisthiocarboxylic acid mononucleotide nickel chelatase